MYLSYFNQHVSHHHHTLQFNFQEPPDWTDIHAQEKHITQLTVSYQTKQRELYNVHCNQSLHMYAFHIYTQGDNFLALLELEFTTYNI